MDKTNMSLIHGNTLELHYWFEDNSHSMDAVVQNRCEYELLGILKEVGLSFSSDLIIETEPVAEGGLRRWFKVILKEENKKATITTAIIVALATVLITTPISKVSEKLIDKIFEDIELKELEKKKLKLEIEKLKQETQKNSELLNQSILIRKRKSNFYEVLEKYPKINKVSFLIENDLKNRVTDEKIINRVDFKEFILTTDDLKPVEVDNALIEIISPVLKNGHYKWMGIYNGISIPFNMKSNEFKTLVQTGKIEFKNGSSINCFLQIRKKVDNDGLEKIVGYDVIRVNLYFENDKPTETPEGKKYRQKQEADKQQVKLSFEKKN